MARARTAELLGVVVGAAPAVARDPEPAIIVEDDVACCDVEAAVVICSPTCSCRRALLVKKFSERRNMSVFCVLVFVGG